MGIIISIPAMIGIVFYHLFVYQLPYMKSVIAEKIVYHDWRNTPVMWNLYKPFTVAWRYQTITLTNIKFLRVFCGIHQKAMSNKC